MPWTLFYIWNIKKHCDPTHWKEISRECEGGGATLSVPLLSFLCYISLSPAPLIIHPSRPVWNWLMVKCVNLKWKQTWLISVRSCVSSLYAAVIAHQDLYSGLRSLSSGSEPWFTAFTDKQSRCFWVYSGSPSHVPGHLGHYNQGWALAILR